MSVAHAADQPQSLGQVGRDPPERCVGIGGILRANEAVGRGRAQRLARSNALMKKEDAELIVEQADPIADESRLDALLIVFLSFAVAEPAGVRQVIEVGVAPGKIVSVPAPVFQSICALLP